MNINVKALVLAAGKGTRLRTEGVDLPKVLRQAAGRPLLAYVLDSLSFLPKESTVLVVGWMKDKVLAAFPDYPHAVQEELNGTGGAVRYAAPLLDDPDGHVLICCGDTPLMEAFTFRALLDAHLKNNNATPEVTPGAYGCRVRELLDSLDKLTTDNAQGELYLTDGPAFIKAAGGRVGLCDGCSETEMLGVNTVEQLSEVERIIRSRA